MRKQLLFIITFLFFLFGRCDYNEGYKYEWINVTVDLDITVTINNRPAIDGEYVQVRLELDPHEGGGPIYVNASTVNGVASITREMELFDDHKIKVRACLPDYEGTYKSGNICDFIELDHEYAEMWSTPGDKGQMASFFWHPIVIIYIEL